MCHKCHIHPGRADQTSVAMVITNVFQKKWIKVLNIFIILTNLFKTFIHFFWKTSVMTMAALVWSALPGCMWHILHFYMIFTYLTSILPVEGLAGFLPLQKLEWHLNNLLCPHTKPLELTFCCCGTTKCFIRFCTSQLVTAWWLPREGKNPRISTGTLLGLPTGKSGHATSKWELNAL